MVSACIIQNIQQISVQLNDYAAAGKNVLDFVFRPKVCPDCGERDAFHVHGYYARFVNDVEIWIARFRCKYCRLDVSVLPEFAMPYRNRSVEVVDRYFCATDEERRNMGGHDTLRRYWKAWQLRWQVIARIVGFHADCARAAWESLPTRFLSVAEAQRHLVTRYMQTLLRQYVVHAPRFI